MSFWTCAGCVGLDKSQHPTHPLHYITTQQTTPRCKKQTTYNNTDINTNPNTIDDIKIKTNMKHIHTTIVNTYLNNQKYNKVTNTLPFTVHHFEPTLPIALVVPWPNSEQTNVPSYFHISIKSTKKKTHRHYSPFAKENHTQHQNKHTAQGFVDDSPRGLESAGLMVGVQSAGVPRSRCRPPPPLLVEE